RYSLKRTSCGLANVGVGCLGAAGKRADKAADHLVEPRLDLAEPAFRTAIGPFDAAVAGAGLIVGQQNQLALKSGAVADLVEFGGKMLAGFVARADHDTRLVMKVDKAFFDQLAHF